MKSHSHVSALSARPQPTYHKLPHRDCWGWLPRLARCLVLAVPQFRELFQRAFQPVVRLFSPNVNQAARKLARHSSQGVRVRGGDHRGHCVRYVLTVLGVRCVQGVLGVRYDRYVQPVQGARPARRFFRGARCDGHPSGEYRQFARRTKIHRHFERDGWRQPRQCQR